MELGDKMRLARMEKGISQRQLCGDVITRNMLSQIEHGVARPSMETLKYLASRLEKPVSWFLDEETVVSPNAGRITAARNHYDAGRFEEAVQALEDWRSPDPVYDREYGLLRNLSLLALAEKAVSEEKCPYARELLQRADRETAYCSRELTHRRLLLLGRLGEPVSKRLPSLDGELLLRAGEALKDGSHHRAAALLDAAEDQTTPDWNLLRGEAFLAAKNYQAAAQCFHAAEETFPKETAPRLEQCYRELEDFKRAYEYACKGR